MSVKRDEDHSREHFDRAENELLDLIRSLLSEMGVLNRVIRLDSDLQSDLGFDSLARMELLLRIERHFEQSVPEEIAVQARTPADLLLGLGQKQAVRLVADIRSLGDQGENAKRSLVTGPQEAKSLIEVLSYHAEHSPDRTHIRLNLGSNEIIDISYAELFAQARLVASGLQSLGLLPGERAALMLATGQDFFYGFMGILMAGLVPVPIYPPFRMDKVEEHLQREVRILTNAGAKVLVTFSEAKLLARLLKSQLPEVKAVVTVSELRAGQSPASVPTPSSEDTALIQYTSGSTGDPKGVVLSHQNLLANVRAMGQAAGVDSSDVLVSWLPLYHDMGLIGAWFAPMYYGMLLNSMPPTAFIARPSEWLWAISRERGTISSAPNFAYEICASRISDAAIEGLDLSSWRFALNGAEPVQPDTLRRFTERFAPYGFRAEAMSPVYGLAECAVGLAFPELNTLPRIEHIDREQLVKGGRAQLVGEETPGALRFVSCGRPIPGHEIRVVNALGHEVGEREEGLLHFRGPSATKGYFNNPEGNKRLLVDDAWRNSGDYAYVADGEIFITRRAKDIIIRAGRNIYPQELEYEVGKIPGVRKGCVAAFGVPDESGSTENLVILAESRFLDAERQSSLSQQISDTVFSVIGIKPDQVKIIPRQSIPKTSSGKIRRSAARDLYLSEEIGQTKAVWHQFLRFALAGLVPSFRRFWRAVADLAYAAYCYLVFSIVVAVFYPLVLLTPGLLRRRRVAKFGAALILKLAGTPIRVEGLENLPSTESHIVASNHQSYLDSLLLTAVLPPSYSFVAKKELALKTVPAVFLRAIGARFVERFDATEAAVDAERLSAVLSKQQERLVIFPEGTFYREPGLRSFHLGAFKIAASNGSPVVPLVIRGTRSIIRDTQFIPRRGSIEVQILPIETALGTDWTDIVELRNRVRTAIGPHCGEPVLGS